MLGFVNPTHLPSVLTVGGPHGIPQTQIIAYPILSLISIYSLSTWSQPSHTTIKLHPPTIPPSLHLAVVLCVRERERFVVNFYQFLGYGVFGREAKLSALKVSVVELRKVELSLIGVVTIGAAVLS